MSQSRAGFYWSFALWTGAALLTAGAVAYHAKGFDWLFRDSERDDLHQRWIEIRYVAKGQNPYDVYYYRYHNGAKPWSDDRDGRIDEAIGAPDDGGYPPWAFFSGWLFLWPSWPVVLWYYVFLNLAALAVIGCWAATLAPENAGWAGKSFLFAGAAAISTYCTTLQVGQYGTIVVAFIAGSLWLLTLNRGRYNALLAMGSFPREGAMLSRPLFSTLLPFKSPRKHETLARTHAFAGSGADAGSEPARESMAPSAVDGVRVNGNDLLAGFLLGVAMLKPTIAGPFFLVLLVKRRWAAAAACVLYVSVAAGVVWLWTATNPIEMCLQMTATGANFIADSQGLVGPLLALGVSRKLITPVLAVGVLLPAVVVMWMFRRRSWPTLFAVAAVAARFWSYHKGYDNAMMVFLLAPLLAAWLREPRNLLLGAGALLVGASLWMPAGLTHSTPILAAQLLTWPGGLAVLLFACKEAGVMKVAALPEPVFAHNGP